MNAISIWRVPWTICLLSSLVAGSATAQSVVQSVTQIEVDLELVLAVDISHSMDVEEQELQRAGFVEAFRHPEVIAAIGSGQIGNIAVTYLEWAGAGVHYQRVHWTLLSDAKSAHAFADALAGAPIGRRRHTSISSGLSVAADLFSASPYTGMRKVIDISGDGPNNSGTAVHLTRQAVVRRGITINGLPIMVRPGDGYYDVLDLHVYYENCVIGGPGAFLLTIKALDQFAEAIRRKLVLEIAGRMPEMIPVTASQAQDDYDCLIGEKLRLQRSPGP